MKLAIRILVGVVIILLIISFIISPAFFSIISQKIYWLELLFLVLIVWGYGLSNVLVLRIALVITFFGAVLNTFVFDQLSEVALRAGLVFWTVGLVKTLTKYRQHAKD